jgi:hypothetical protein
VASLTLARISDAQWILEGPIMKTKSIATVLVLFAFAAAGSNPASAQSPGSRGDGFRGGGGGNFQGPGPNGRGFNRHGHHRGVGQIFVGDGYEPIDAYSGEWYGITPGYDECPRFRQRVMTPDGERIRMIPVC